MAKSAKQEARDLANDAVQDAAVWAELERRAATAAAVDSALAAKVRTYAAAGRDLSTYAASRIEKK